MLPTTVLYSVNYCIDMVQCPLLMCLVQESIMLNENTKYVRRNADHILDSLFESLHAAPSPPCRWEITRCIGRVGHVMEADIKR